MFFRGLIAGAAGTLALDLLTYADMLARARPASELPSMVVQKLAERGGIAALAEESEAATNRRSGAGAIFGYGVGLGSGVGYALLRPAFRDIIPWPIAGAVLGAATLVVSEGWATALGATDWSTWSLADWVSDIVPRTLYGLTVAAVIEHLDDGPATDAGSQQIVVPATSTPATSDGPYTGAEYINRDGDA